MRTRFSYTRPSSLGELHTLMAEQREYRKILAGGTDLLPNIRLGIEAPSMVVDIKGVPGFTDLSYHRSDGLFIGPCVTITGLMEDPGVKRRYSILHSCAEELASRQIRNRATVAGNVVNASPCSDMAPALLCLGARARISSREGTRDVPFSDFFSGVKQTILRPHEVLETIVVPKEMVNAHSGYRKLKRIRGHDLGIIGVALVKHQNGIRVAVSSAAPVPILVPDFSPGASISEVKNTVMAAISPIDDVRCTREYREFMVGVYIERLMQEV